MRHSISLLPLALNVADSLLGQTFGGVTGEFRDRSGAFVVGAEVQAVGHSLFHHADNRRIAGVPDTGVNGVARS
jgi:hypothetical protein